MSERVQPGAEVPRETYEKFKTFVKNHEGTLRGNLGAALDRAMQDYMKAHEGAGPAERIEQDLATVNRNVAENRELLRELAETVDDVEADGGAYALSGGETTHTHRSEPNGADTRGLERNGPEVEPSGTTPDATDAPDEAPHPKASRRKKAEWLAAQYVDADEIHRELDLADEVGRVYSFNDDATAKLVSATADRLDHVPHPSNDAVLVPPARAEQLRAELRAEEQDDATERVEELDTGHDETTPTE
jgi:hypothetical protein